ncbi:MAG: hypothetical protein EZS28_055066 [Streblomastix strix]|uniref:Uncharacterized protein n=1 Tax=Streblomastix strix TaxID=222440 RepID=A0A5J4Q9B7_9EUKA|nr:MAG: hypothetical protein EZS28_055066 [Streblomastix strix]
MQQCIQRPQYDFQPLRTGQQLRKMEVIGSGTLNDQRIRSLIEGGGGIEAWQKSKSAQQSTRQSPFAALEPFNTIVQLQQQQQQKEQQAPTYQQYNPPQSANASTSTSTSSIQQHTDTTSIHNKPIYQTTQLNPPPFSTSSLDNLPINAYDPTEDGAIRSVENTCMEQVIIIQD